MQPITYIKTPYRQKFGVPRQPLLVPEAWGVMSFDRNEFFSEAFRGLENFSHLWLIFQFHQFKQEKVSSLVQPPRFDGEKKMGVFATRSPFRPNHLGLSVVKLKEVRKTHNQIEIHVAGVDLLNETPILDIKPYIPYCDAHVDAKATFFEEPPKMHPVIWSVEVDLLVEERLMIEKTIAMDPRPGHYKFLNRDHAVLISDWNVRFRFENGLFTIYALEKADQPLADDNSLLDADPTAGV